MPLRQACDIRQYSCKPSVLSTIWRDPSEVDEGADISGDAVADWRGSLEVGEGVDISGNAVGEHPAITMIMSVARVLNDK